MPLRSPTTRGLGTPGKYPYNVGLTAGRAVLNAVRAAEGLPGSNLSRSAKVVVFGYSQGGLGADSAAQLAPRYAPELDLRGAGIGAPPAYVRSNIAYLDGAEDFGLSLAAVYGVDAAYPDLHLERYLNAKGRAAFKEIANQCVFDLIAPKSKWQGHTLSEYTTTNILNLPDWRARLRQSSLGRRTPKVPVLLYNSKDDEIVPFTGAARLRRAWCRKDADLTFYPLRTGGHGDTGFLMEPVVNGGLAGRMLRLPRRSRC